MQKQTFLTYPSIWYYLLTIAKGLLLFLLVNISLIKLFTQQSQRKHKVSHFVFELRKRGQNPKDEHGRRFRAAALSSRLKKFRLMYCNVEFSGDQFNWVLHKPVGSVSGS